MSKKKGKKFFIFMVSVNILLLLIAVIIFYPFARFRSEMILDIEQSATILFDPNFEESGAMELDSLEKDKILERLSNKTLKPSFIVYKNLPSFYLLTDKYKIGIMSSGEEIVVVKGEKTYRYKLNEKDSVELEKLCTELMNKGKR